MKTNDSRPADKHLLPGGNPSEGAETMAKMWAGRTDGTTDRIADDFNSSIRFDSRMYRQDILGSIAHASMLGAQGIIAEAEAETLIAGLQQILSDLEDGTLSVDPLCEDIHMFVEEVLTKRLGEVGKKLHTARSRNDQVALDLRMYLREEIADLQSRLNGILRALGAQAKCHRATVMPGYTHLQRAQPITFGHHLMAYAMMFLRDCDRLSDCHRRMNVSPIGCCALAGTTYPTDRAAEARELGFDGVCMNSLDGVSDRDFCVELMSTLSILMMHLSRLCEELVLWSSWEFRFIDLPDSFTTGSSIMPQKKNPDMAELVRGKTGRVYGDLMALLTVMKGLPLAYNKDMQEDKESVFDACDTVRMCLDVMTPMLRTMKANPEQMLRAAQKGFINATDIADYLVRKGMPFRTAYHISGEIVAKCIAENKVPEALTQEEYHSFSELFGEDIYREISLSACVERRNSAGGTSPASVDQQVAYLEAYLCEHTGKGI